MLFFSSSVGAGFGGDFIYTRQISNIINSMTDSLIIKIEHIKFKYIPIIFLLCPLFILFPFMWRPMFRYKNIATVLSHLNNGKDTIVVDHFRNAWVILFCLVFRDKKVILITHNIEYMIAKENYLTKKIFIRFFYYFEYLKIKFWENIVFKYVDDITTITEEDANTVSLYSAKISVVKPYYEKVKQERNISLSEDAKCLIVGSFNWKIKQDNLITLLKAFKLSEKPDNFEIVIAGTMPEFFSKLICQKFSFVKLRLNYSNIDDLINISRLAIAPDQVGGGFKLKLLDYFYLGLPVFGLEHSMNGIDSNTIGVDRFSRYASLVDGVLLSINDIEKLDVMSKSNQNLLRNCFTKEVMEQQFKDLLYRKIST